VNSGKKSCRRFQKSADVEDYSVNASITTLNGFSAHADQKKLLQWAEALPQR
jgi:predicted metal-dependent RNase